MIYLSYNKAPIFIITLTYKLKTRDDFSHNQYFFVISLGGIIRRDNLSMTKPSIAGAIVAKWRTIKHNIFECTQSYGSGL